MTGHWQGHHRFRDNAADIAAFIRAAGLDQSHSPGHRSQLGLTAAALPTTGLRPVTLVPLTPVSFARISLEASAPAATRRVDGRGNRSGPSGRAQLERGRRVGQGGGPAQPRIEAARSVLLDNGDWDGGLVDLRDPAAAGLDVWLVRGDPATGGYVDDEAARAFGETIGKDHIITIDGGPHSPQRTHPAETVAAFLRAIGPTASPVA